MNSETFQDKNELYETLVLHGKGMLKEEPEWLPNLCNASALLWSYLQEINWAGFYVVCGDHLILGPFQGKPACVSIGMGNGVCGTAWATGEVQLIEDVHQFPGHIACDGASNSEIVLPIRWQGEIVAVLDIDSPVFKRFDTEDQKGLEGFVEVLESVIDWSRVQSAYQMESNLKRKPLCSIGF